MDKEYYIIRDGKATQVRRREFEKEVRFDRLEVLFEDEGDMVRRVAISCDDGNLLSQMEPTTFEARVTLGPNDYGNEKCNKIKGETIASALQELNFVGRDYISDEELFDLLGQGIELSFKFVH